MEVSSLRTGLAVRANIQHGTAWLFMSGELDVATRSHVEKSLAEAQAGHDTVVVDLEELEFMDSNGIHAFLGAARRAGAKGGQFNIVNCPARVRKIFELTGAGFLLGQY